MMMHEPNRFTGLRGRLARDVPLAKYTSWRAGGPADVLYVPADRDDLATFLRQLPPDEPLTVLGLGSNTLVRDGGVRGTVVIMHNPGAALAVADSLIYAEAGAASPKLARFAATHGCAEAEFLAGVPGTVGGALAMNAGCYGGETWRYVARVEVLTRRGEFEVRTPDRYDIGYRHVAPMDGIFTAGWFRFPQGDGSAATPDSRSRSLKDQPNSSLSLSMFLPRVVGYSLGALRWPPALMPPACFEWMIRRRMETSTKTMKAGMGGSATAMSLMVF